jgi:hypothetical protein
LLIDFGFAKADWMNFGVAGAGAGAGEVPNTVIVEGGLAIPFTVAEILALPAAVHWTCFVVCPL